MHHLCIELESTTHCVHLKPISLLDVTFVRKRVCNRKEKKTQSLPPHEQHYKVTVAKMYLMDIFICHQERRKSRYSTHRTGRL